MNGPSTSTLYQIVNGKLKRTPRYGVGYDAELLPTGNYALVYTKNIGKYGKINMEAKVISKINGETDFKLIEPDYRSGDTDYDKEQSILNLRQKVEDDVFTQLYNAPSQQTLSNYRKKHKKLKPKPRRCKCK